jgi:cell wall-associated NlpC family hydrolase
MKITTSLIIFIIYIALIGCNSSRQNKSKISGRKDVRKSSKLPDSQNDKPSGAKNLNNKIVEYAETFLGTKYKYGGTSPEKGFDCSGFAFYVFEHFNIKVPRVSRDFANIGEEISIQDSEPGDIILFTETDTTGWKVGHVGIISKNENGDFKFIHSSSGRSVGVITSNLSTYFKTRFVKVIRLAKN